jgi:two-component system, cell cycle response regulator DivK
MAGEPILVVDDTPVNLKLTRILLTHEGYDVRTANGGPEALEILESFHPRLILADIQMPGMDGLEMTRRIKADPRHSDIVVVALTALAMQGDEEKALQAGCDGYITKPIDTRALGNRIREFLHQEPGEAPPDSADPFADAGIDDLRRRFLDEALQQAPIWIEQLDGTFDADAARSIAHQWVGSAGLLGYAKVSHLSREVETILRQKPLDVAELTETLDALVEELEDPELAHRSSAPAAEAAPATGDRPRVLLADDDHNVRALIKAFLESQNVECATVADGTAAVAAILEGRPDAAVLDVNMPELSGYEVLETIRRRGYTGKIFLLTADEHPDTSGVDDFLVKPFDPVELVVRLKRLLGGPVVEPPR